MLHFASLPSHTVSQHLLIVTSKVYSPKQTLLITWNKVTYKHSFITPKQ